MQIVRVYAGDDGESHFEDLTVEQFAEIVNRVGPATLPSTPVPRPTSPTTTPRPAAST